MKKISFTIFLFPLFFYCQNWQWAKQGKSTTTDYVHNTCTDSSGSVYIIGEFGDESTQALYMLFDNDTVFNYGVNQIYIAKYSSTGAILWVKGIGGNNPNSGGAGSYLEQGLQVFYDVNTNSILATGIFYGTAILGNDTLSGSEDVFFAKLDLNGNFQWAKTIFSSAMDIATNSITTDPLGNIYISGGSSSSVNFGNSITAPAGAFIAEYSVNGLIIWAKKISVNAYVAKIIYSGNSLYVLNGTLSNNINIDTINFTSSSHPNSVFSRFTVTGSVIWSKLISSSNTAYPGDMCQDTSGNFFISGYFVTDVRFATDTLYNSNTADLFFTKFDSSGNFLWARQANASGTGLGMGGGVLAMTPDNNTYVTGGIDGSAALGAFNISSSGSNNMYVSRFDNNGNCLGAVVYSFGGDFATDNSGSYFIAGKLMQSLTFSGTTLTPVGTCNIFLAKHDAITGINNLKQSAQNNQLFIYANPNEGKCDIKVPEDFLHEKNLVLSIYDNTGKLIQQATLEMMNNGKVNLSLEQEAKGIYNVTLSNKSKTYNGKIVFE